MGVPPPPGPGSQWKTKKRLEERIKYVQYPKVKNYPESLYLEACHGIGRRVGWGGEIKIRTQRFLCCSVFV